jgi:hypothetical protein
MRTLVLGGATESGMTKHTLSVCASGLHSMLFHPQRRFQHSSLSFRSCSYLHAGDRNMTIMARLRRRYERGKQVKLATMVTRCENIECPIMNTSAIPSNLGGCDPASGTVAFISPLHSSFNRFFLFWISWVELQSIHNYYPIPGTISTLIHEMLVSTYEAGLIYTSSFVHLSIMT